ncbi:hypothetical protein DMUE_3092 [Dictyocoela muelleri]|nr:hypothetical protein DMUE_3092 [Dictyocoela muelleri]
MPLNKNSSFYKTSQPGSLGHRETSNIVSIYHRYLLGLAPARGQDTNIENCKVTKEKSHVHSSLKLQNKIHELKKIFKKVLNSNETFNDIFLESIKGIEKFYLIIFLAKI